MHRRTLMVAAVAVLSLVAAACGGDESSTYEATRPGSDGPTRTVTPNTPPRTSEPTDPPGTIVLPTFPGTSTTVDEPSSSVPASGDVEVTSTWFGDDGYGGYDWGIVFDNTSSTAFEYLSVDVVFLDAAGQELTTEEATIDLAAPGVGALADYTYGITGVPASMEVTVGEGEPSTSDFGTGTITVGGLAQDAASSAVSGQLTSTFATDLSTVSVTGVWRDPAGAVVRIAGDNVSSVQANGVTWFTIPFVDEAIGVPTEVYWGLSPIWDISSPPDAALTIQESWLHPDGADGFTWGTILANGGSTVWGGTIAQADFFDAENRLVRSETAYFSEVRPGPSAAVGSLSILPSPIVRMEVTLSDGGYEDDTADAGALTIDQVAIANPDATTLTVTGQIASTFAEEQSFVELVLVWRGADNSVAYSTSGYTDTIPANGTAPFEVSAYGDNVPTTPPTEIYWEV